MTSWRRMPFLHRYGCRRRRERRSEFESSGIFFFLLQFLARMRECGGSSSSSSASPPTETALQTAFEESFPDQRFTVFNALGDEVELVPGGKDIKVVYANRLRFIDAALRLRLHEIDTQVCSNSLQPCHAQKHSYHLNTHTHIHIDRHTGCCYAPWPRDYGPYSRSLSVHLARG